MKKSQIKATLTKRALNINDLNAFNELLRYAFQVTDNDLFKFGWNNEDIKKSKTPILENAFVLGWFDKQKLISQIALYPMKMNIYHRIFDMGGITGVATYPEYSGIGLMADLMREILGIMRQRGQSISCLYPYSIPYYRSRGWEIVSDKMSFSLKDTQLPSFQAVNGMIRRVEENSEDLIKLHNMFARQTHGCLMRDNLAWEEYWRWDIEDTIVAIYYDENNAPSGYIVYLLQEDVFYIKEMIYLNEEARNGLWGYVGAHKSMFERIEGANFTNHSLAFLLEDGHINERISPYIMARIVDVEAFLRDFPFDRVNEKFCLYLNISDCLLAWNNGLFRLRFSPKGCSVRKESSPTDSLDSKNVRVDSDANSSAVDSKDFLALDSRLESRAQNLVTLSIQTLVAMMLGYKRPLYLRSIGRLKASDIAINHLEAVLPEGKAYFSDYF